MFEIAAYGVIAIVVLFFVARFAMNYFFPNDT